MQSPLGSSACPGNLARTAARPWPPALHEAVVRVRAAQTPELADALERTAAALLAFRAEAAGQLLRAFEEPSTLDPASVDALGRAVAGLPGDVSRAFCRGLPRLGRVLPAPVLRDLAHALVRLPLSTRGTAQWSAVLDAAVSLATRPGLSAALRDRLVRLLLRLVVEDSAAVAGELRAAADAVVTMRPATSASFIAVAESLVDRQRAACRAWLQEGPLALTALPASRQSACLTSAVAAAQQHPEAPLALVQSSAGVLSAVGPGEWRSWLQAAGALVGYEALVYYRRQSRRSARVLRTARRYLELGAVQPLLACYCTALAAQHVEVGADATQESASLRTADLQSSGPQVVLPALLPVRAAGLPAFTVYKVMATHQMAHLEFGSGCFSYERPACCLPTLRPPGRRGGLAAFLSLFQDLDLALAILRTVEDGRIDACIARQYAGLRVDFLAVQRAERRSRPALHALQPRAALSEALVRHSLGGRVYQAPEHVRLLLPTLRALVRVVQQPDATVEDSAEATLRLYALFAALPAPHEQEIAVTLMHEHEVPEELASAQHGSGPQAGGEQAIAQPGYRQHRDATLEQARMRARGEQDGGGTPLTPDELRRLLENGPVDVDLGEADLPSEGGLFVTDLQNKPPVRLRVRSASRATPDHATVGVRSPERPRARRFVYDEWDFRAHDYRPEWCQLFERPMDEAAGDFVADTLAAYPGVAAAIRRRILLMRPHHMAKRRGLPDGEDLDLDAAIDRVIALRSRIDATDRVFWARQRLERDVAVAILLDMSASTDAEVVTAAGRRRIVDVEKEGLALLSNALESVGDRYGIYGFSGYGRDNVEYYIVKELDERYSATISRRIAGVRPLRSTRMGPAIRHALTKLQRSGAALRVLLLLSDGYPQDHDYYGIDRLEREYALHDTRMALLEARRRGVVPFCLTVDQAGYDYLRTMCDGFGYEVVRDLATLPERLGVLYAQLTR